MGVHGPKSGAPSGNPSWNVVEQLSDECQALVDDVNNFISTHFPQMQSNAVVLQKQARQSDSFEGTPKPNTPPAIPSIIDDSSANSAGLESSVPTVATPRTAPTGVMGAVADTMSTARSAWESYEDEYQLKSEEAYEGEGFDRYFSNGIENRVNLRMRKFDDHNFDSRYYDYHYLEHHLRENDDERLADRMRADERRAEERAMLERESDYEAERRMELEMERRDDYRMNYEEE